jgi:hypothetical protein
MAILQQEASGGQISFCPWLDNAADENPAGMWINGFDRANGHSKSRETNDAL